MNNDELTFEVPRWAPFASLVVFVVVVVIIVGLFAVYTMLTEDDKRECRRSGRAVVVDYEHNEWTCREIKP